MHVPKTAGNSITDALMEYIELNYKKGKGGKYPGANHEKAMTVKELVGEKIWNSYFKFAFVRNPWERTVSSYYYKMQNNNFIKNNPEEYKKIKQTGNFNTCLRQGVGFPVEQVEKLIDDKGKIMVDFIGRFENLQEDFNRVCDRISIPRIELPYVNKAIHKHYSYYYDEETKETVREMYKKDIEAFGYEFEDKRSEEEEIADRNNKKYMLIKTLGAGIGNRFHQLLYDLLYCKMTGRIPVIDWNDGTFANEGENAFYKYFECLGSADLFDVLHIKSVAPKVWQGKLGLSGKSFKEFLRQQKPDIVELGSYVNKHCSVDLSHLGYEENVLVQVSPTAGKGAKGAYNYKLEKIGHGDKEKGLHKIFWEYIKPKKTLRNRVEGFKKKYFKGKVIGVHIRCSDNIKEGGEINPNFGEFPKKIDKAIKNLDEYTIFLATDNKLIQNEYEKRYDNLVFLDKEFVTPAKPLHRPRKVSKEKMAIDSFTDLFLLASCDVIIYSSISSFPRIACIIAGDNAEKIDIESPERLQEVGSNRGNFSKYGLPGLAKGEQFKEIYSKIRSGFLNNKNGEEKSKSRLEEMRNILKRAKTIFGR